MNKPHPIALDRNTVSEVPLDLIVFDPLQPRTEFDEARLAELADDIRVNGVNQPIELVPIDGGLFAVDTGERRVRAARQAGLDTIRAVAAKPHGTPLDQLVHQAAENILRDALTVMDKARLLKRLRDEHGISVKSLPEFCKTNRIGDWSRSHISNMIRMTELPDWFTVAISAGDVPASAAKSVAQIADLPRAMEVFEKEFAELVAGAKEDGVAITESDVAEWVFSAAAACYVRADVGWAKNAPYYDVLAHADAVGVRTIGSAQFITDQLAHDVLQAQHPKPHPNSPAANHPHVHGKPDTHVGAANANADGAQDETDKADKKPRDKLLDVVNPQKVENYLIGWWRHYISMHARTPQVVNAVVSWCAAGAPMDKSAYFGYSINDIGVAKGLQKACEEFKRSRLSDFLAHDLDEDDRLTLFDRALEAMDSLPIVDIVQWRGWDFEELYRIDSDLLAMHTKATLDKLVRDTVAKGKAGTEARQSWNDCVKLEAMRGWALARAEEIGVPKELAKVWRELQARTKA